MLYYKTRLLRPRAPSSHVGLQPSHGLTRLAIWRRRRTAARYGKGEKLPLPEAGVAQAPQGSPVGERGKKLPLPEVRVGGGNFETSNENHPFVAIARTGRESSRWPVLPVKGTQQSFFLSPRPRKTSAHTQYGGRRERVEFRECGAEDHWEGVEPPLPKFRSHQDWIMRVQLALCRICVAVPALFGRGSPLKEPSNSSLILRSSRP